MLWFKKVFKLRVSQSWFSSDFVQFEYTTNNGWSWNTIKTCYHPFLDGDDYGMETLTTRLSEDNINFYKKQFSRLEDIQKYETDQRKLRDDGNKSLYEERKRRMESKKEILRKANQ